MWLTLKVLVQKSTPEPINLVREFLQVVNVCCPQSEILIDDENIPIASEVVFVGGKGLLIGDIFDYLETGEVMDPQSIDDSGTVFDLHAGNEIPISIYIIVGYVIGGRVLPNKLSIEYVPEGDCLVGAHLAVDFELNQKHGAI